MNGPGLQSQSDSTPMFLIKGTARRQFAFFSLRRTNDPAFRTQHIVGIGNTNERNGTNETIDIDRKAVFNGVPCFFRTTERSKDSRRYFDLEVSILIVLVVSIMIVVVVVVVVALIVAVAVALIMAVAVAVLLLLMMITWRWWCLSMMRIIFRVAANTRRSSTRVVLILRRTRRLDRRILGMIVRTVVTKMICPWRLLLLLLLRRRRIATTTSTTSALLKVGFGPMHVFFHVIGKLIATLLGCVTGCRVRLWLLMG